MAIDNKIVSKLLNKFKNRVDPEPEVKVSTLDVILDNTIKAEINRQENVDQQKEIDLTKELLTKVIELEEWTSYADLTEPNNSFKVSGEYVELLLNGKMKLGQESNASMFPLYWLYTIWKDIRVVLHRGEIKDFNTTMQTSRDSSNRNFKLIFDWSGEMLTTKLEYDAGTQGGSTYYKMEWENFKISKIRSKKTYDIMNDVRVFQAPLKAFVANFDDKSDKNLLNELEQNWKKFKTNETGTLSVYVGDYEFRFSYTGTTNKVVFIFMNKKISLWTVYNSDITMGDIKNLTFLEFCDKVENSNKYGLSTNIFDKENFITELINLNVRTDIKIELVVLKCTVLDFLEYVKTIPSRLNLTPETTNSIWKDWTREYHNRQLSLYYSGDGLYDDNLLFRKRMIKGDEHIVLETNIKASKGYARSDLGTTKSLQGKSFDESMQILLKKTDLIWYEDTTTNESKDEFIKNVKNEYEIFELVGDFPKPENYYAKSFPGVDGDLLEIGFLKPGVSCYFWNDTTTTKWLWNGSIFQDPNDGKLLSFDEAKTSIKTYGPGVSLDGTRANLNPSETAWKELLEWLPKVIADKTLLDKDLERLVKYQTLGRQSAYIGIELSENVNITINGTQTHHDTSTVNFKDPSANVALNPKQGPLQENFTSLLNSWNLSIKDKLTVAQIDALNEIMLTSPTITHTFNYDAGPSLNKWAAFVANANYDDHKEVLSTLWSDSIKNLENSNNGFITNLIKVPFEYDGETKNVVLSFLGAVDVMVFAFSKVDLDVNNPVSGEMGKLMVLLDPEGDGNIGVPYPKDWLVVQKWLSNPLSWIRYPGTFEGDWVKSFDMTKPNKLTIFKVDEDGNIID